LEGDILIIDDVITAGTAIREAMDIIDANGAKAKGVIVAVDRQEKGKGDKSAIQEVEENFGIVVLSIINLGHLIDYLKQGDDQALIERIEAYRNQYGV
jgi:orotate phosphoribosyltransferase